MEVWNDNCRSSEVHLPFLVCNDDCRPGEVHLPFLPAGQRLRSSSKCNTDWSQFCSCAVRNKDKKLLLAYTFVLCFFGLSNQGQTVPFLVPVLDLGACLFTCSTLPASLLWMCVAEDYNNSLSMHSSGINCI